MYIVQFFTFLYMFENHHNKKMIGEKTNVDVKYQNSPFVTSKHSHEEFKLWKMGLSSPAHLHYGWASDKPMLLY